MICHCTLHAQQLPEGSDANSDPSDKSIARDRIGRNGSGKVRTLAPLSEL